MKDKECKLCKERISKVESYYVIQTYTKGKLLGENYYHKICFDATSGMEEDIQYIKNKSKELLAKTEKLIEVVQK